MFSDASAMPLPTKRVGRSVLLRLDGTLGPDSHGNRPPCTKAESIQHTRRVTDNPTTRLPGGITGEGEGMCGTGPCAILSTNRRCHRGRRKRVRRRRLHLEENDFCLC